MQIIEVSFQENKQILNVSKCHVNKSDNPTLHTVKKYS